MSSCLIVYVSQKSVYIVGVHEHKIRLMIRICLINIPVVLCKERFVKLQKKLPISVPVHVVNLVGRVIWRKRLNEVNISKKMLQCSCSFIFNMLML